MSSTGNDEEGVQFILVQFSGIELSSVELVNLCAVSSLWFFSWRVKAVSLGQDLFLLLLLTGSHCLLIYGSRMSNWPFIRIAE